MYIVSFTGPGFPLKLFCTSMKYCYRFFWSSEL